MLLFRKFILRHLVHVSARSVSTAVGIALGIAVILAIRMANASSVNGFASALEAIAGKTALEVTASAGGLEESRLSELGWLEDYGSVSPVIEGEVRLRTGKGSWESLRVLGVDILRDQSFREYHLLEFGEGKQEPGPDQILSLLADPSSVILTERFAGRHRITIGQTVEIVVGDRIRGYTVRGLLKPAGPARTLDGNFVLMDIAAAQWAFDFLGRLTRLDLLIDGGLDLETVERSIAAKLPPGLTVQRPSRRGREVEKMLAAFHFNLTALSYIALLVGLFLIYNTISVSVIARRREVGILRALGTSRGRLILLFLGEASLLALVGCAAGLPIARFLALGAVNLTATTVNVLYSGIVSPPPPLGFGDIVLALSIGLPLALIAAIAPALEASRVLPVDAMRGSDRLETRYRLRSRYLLIPLALFLAGWWLCGLGPVDGIPLFGFVGALAFSFAGAFLAPAALYGLARSGGRPALRFLGTEARLAYANLAGSIPRLSVSVAALSLSISMMVAIAVMVGSFRETVIYWVKQTLQADLFVNSSMRGDAGTQVAISPEVESVISRHPSVAAIDPFRRIETSYESTRIPVGYSDFSVLLAHGGLLFKEPRDGRDAVRGAIGKDAVLVSESFSLRHGRHAGDYVVLQTPDGSERFRVAAVYFDYSSDRGFVVMDRGTFVRHYGDLRPTGLRVYLKEGADANVVRDSILSELGDRFRLYVSTNVSLQREIMRIFDSTFAITYALEVIAVAVAVMGIACTLLTLILERRRELAVLRLLGADRRQIRKMVIIEALLLGIVSQGIGVAVGLALSLILIYVINVQSFGWTIQFHLPTYFLVQMSAVILAATAVAGLYPARCASRFEAAGEVTQE